MTKTRFLEKKWEFEKKVGKMIIGMTMFGIAVATEIGEFLGDILDEISDILYDNTGMSGSEANTVAGVVVVYLLVILIDRIFDKFVPWTIKKLSRRKTTQTEVSE